MIEPKGCPTPGACSALKQIAELTKDRDHWREAYRNALAAADLIIEFERQRVLDALENSARLIEERNAIQMQNVKLRDALVEIATGKFPKAGDEFTDDSMRLFARSVIAGSTPHG